MHSSSIYTEVFYNRIHTL